MRSFITRTYEVKWATSWSYKLQPEHREFDTLEEALEDIKKRVEEQPLDNMLAFQINRMEILQP